MESIKIKNLSKGFQNKMVLDNLNINIGGSFGLLGPNGAGKTTLMRILTTQINQDKGQITYKDKNWDKKEDIRKIIGYLPQYLSMYKGLNVIEVLEHFSFLKGNSTKKNRHLEVQKVLEQVNLVSEQKTKIRKLSGGMLRRVGIAQALLGEPKILVIDEPTAGLDVEERTRFRRLLRSISKDKIIVISSHIVEDLESTCDNIAIIRKGQILDSGTREEVTKIAEGSVFEVELSQKDLNGLNEEDVISTKQVGSNYRVRFFSEDKEGMCTTELPTLEDAYLYRMRSVKNEK